MGEGDIEPKVTSEEMKSDEQKELDQPDYLTIDLPDGVYISNKPISKREHDRIVLKILELAAREKESNREIGRGFTLKDETGAYPFTKVGEGSPYERTRQHEDRHVTMDDRLRILRQNGMLEQFMGAMSTELSVNPDRYEREIKSILLSWDPENIGLKNDSEYQDLIRGLGQGELSAGEFLTRIKGIYSADEYNIFFTHLLDELYAGQLPNASRLIAEWFHNAEGEIYLPKEIEQ